MADDTEIMDGSNATSQRAVPDEPETPDAASEGKTKQMQELNLYLDVATKIIPLSIALFIALGAVEIWLYLAKFNLTSEFPQLISSSQVLFQLTIFSLALTGVVVLAAFIGPSLYRNACEELYLSRFSRESFVFDFLVLGGMILIQFALSVSSPGGDKGFRYLLSVLIVTTIVYFIRRKFVPVEGRRQGLTFVNKAYAFAIYMLSLYLMLLPLLFLLLLASKALPAGWFGYVLFTGCVIGYALVASLFIASRDKAIVSLLFVIMVVFVIAQDKAILFFMKKYGLSQYLTTLSIEKKSTAIPDSVKEIASKKQKSNNEEASIYKDIWVLVDLPSNIVFSAYSSSNTYVVIPRSAVTGKLKHEATSSRAR